MIDVKYKAFGLILIFVAISFIGYWEAMDLEMPPPEVQASEHADQPVLYFGVISRYSPRSIIAGYQPLMDYLTEATPYRFKLRLSRSYQETVDQLSRGNTQFASLGNFTYIHAYEEHGVRCIAIPLNEAGNLENYDDVIVRKDSPLKSLGDLHGHSFALASPQSFSSWIAVWMLEDAGVSLNDLSHYEHHSHHDLVAEKVLRGDFDAGMVKAVVADDFLEDGIRVIQRSPKIPPVPLVSAPHVDPEMITHVLEALLEIGDLKSSGQLSTEDWDPEVASGFIAGHDSLYTFPRQILSDLRELGIEY